MDIKLQPNITGTNVNLVKGATQADLTNSVNNSKIYRDEAEAFSIVSEAKSVEASYSALNASISSTTASDKATIATTKANEANNSAINASASEAVCIAKAIIATDNADIAIAQAVIATNKATEANTSANTANTQANIAITKASEASISASNALTSKNAAASSATSASTSASTATTKASEAASSASDAASALSTMQLLFDNFDDRFLGTKTSDPTLDNDGNALLVGAIYYNSVAKDLRFYNGVSWDAPSTSATNAATSATNASNFASIATTKAFEASDSATSASTSATTATNQATIATTKAGEASASEASALSSKNASALSETNAKTSETNAALSEANALAYKNSASGSATTATTKAGIATTKASEASASATSASTSANTATTKASEASISASNALTSENNADTSEANALTYRNQAEAFANSINPSDLVHISGTETITGNKTFSGTVSGLTKATVGLGNVDNTSDSAKNVLYATTAGTASANDVYAWAKASVKPTYTASEVGLGNVTNESKATMFTNSTLTGTVTLPSTTSIGTISSTELGYIDGVTSNIQTQLNSKNPKLVSGTNIKTINSSTILGSGNINLVDLTTNQTIAGVKTFSSTIDGNINGNAETANTLISRGGFPNADGQDFNTLTTTGVYFVQSDNYSGTLNSPGGYGTLFVNNASPFTSQLYMNFYGGIIRGRVGYDSNWSDWSEYVTLTGNQTIAGVKTFSSSPIVPTPTTGTQAVNKNYVDSSALPIGAILNAYTIFGNCIVAFGGEFNRADYPKLWAYLQANPTLVKTQAEWTTENTTNGMCGYFSDGNGTTTFRVPNLDKAFLRPDSRTVGSYQGDAIRDITGSFKAWREGATTSGAFVDNGNLYTTNLTAGYAISLTIVSLDASLVVPTANENRPKNIAVLPLIVAK